MKKFPLLLVLLLAFCTGHTQLLQKAKDKLSAKKNSAPPVKETKSSEASLPTALTVTPTDTATTADNGKLIVYNNYDFIPGDTVVFEDHFADDELGEFPAHWNLGAGQAVMNRVAGQRAFLLTAGNYAHVSPLVKGLVFFSDAFTIEFDWYFNGGYGPHIYFYEKNSDAQKAVNYISDLSLDHQEALITTPSAELELSAPFPEAVSGEAHRDSWHHIAIAYKKNQLKIYLDQYRVLVVPKLGVAPHAFDIEGIGDMNTPIVLTNFRVARGAGMNMLGKKFTDTKIVTHGINFDIDKATIRPESMGTLNMIMQVLKENPDLRFEIGGHTDNSGTPAHNLTLSQQRAAAVKAQLVSMGIDAARLSCKGFGSTKPLSDNGTPEGKANNRRVEFTKL